MSTALHQNLHEQAGTLCLTAHCLCRSGDAEADHRSASSEPQKEARHRKDDAAGRSLGEDAHQGKHAPEQGRAPAEGPETAGKVRRGNPARHLAGIWKELNDDSMDSDDDKDRDKEQEQVMFIQVTPSPVLLAVFQGVQEAPQVNVECNRVEQSEAPL